MSIIIPFSRVYSANDAFMYSEIMLINLLDTLEFSLGSKEIYWNLGTLQTPVLKGVDDITPQLPLKISFAT